MFTILDSHEADRGPYHYAGTARVAVSPDDEAAGADREWPHARRDKEAGAHCPPGQYAGGSAGRHA
jgi:hypothetical protein